MNKLYLPIGLIGSGKSTWARAFIKDHPDTKIVGGDEIRFMLGGGNYVYDESLEPTVLRILDRVVSTVLHQGYDVILDECYCSLTRDMRKRVAAINRGDELIAVVFPVKDMTDHIEDKVIKGLRGKTVAYWKRVFCEMKEIYEPFDPEEKYFSEAIYI